MIILYPTKHVFWKIFLCAYCLLLVGGCKRIPQDVYQAKYKRLHIPLVTNHTYSAHLIDKLTQTIRHTVSRQTGYQVSTANDADFEMRVVLLSVNYSDALFGSHSLAIGIKIRIKTLIEIKDLTTGEIIKEDYIEATAQGIVTPPVNQVRELIQLHAMEDMAIKIVDFLKYDLK